MWIRQAFRVPAHVSLAEHALAVADGESEDRASAVGADPVAITTACQATRWFTRAVR